MKKNRISSILVALTLLISIYSNACTTAVISGKYTKDGRPMLWKNRDTYSINNILHYFNDGKYTFVGLVNSKDTKFKSVWIGMNSEGFAIMNSASYNLNFGCNAKLTGLEGRVMKEALATCKNLAEFEAYLKALPQPTGLEANFGVIDAEGGAAFYEIGQYGFEKFDANDPKIAPFGYIIRGNYSHTGRLGNESGGYIRYNTASELFYEKASTDGLTAQYIQQNCAKSLRHSLLKEDLVDVAGNLPPNHPKFKHFRDYIARSGSSSSCVVEGVKKGENPNLVTLWANVGFPLTSVIVPVWVDKTSLPSIVDYNTDIKDSPICHAALTLKDSKVLPIRWGKAEHQYIDVNSVYNNKGTGITQVLKNYEDVIYKKTYHQLSKWRQNGSTNSKDIKAFYQWINTYIKDAYKKEFNLNL